MRLATFNIENLGSDRAPLHFGPRIVDGLRRVWRVARGLWCGKPLQRHELTPEESRLLEAASGAGVELALCAGAGPVHKHRSRHVVGRDRTEVRAAAAATGSGDRWLYPALLAMAGEDVELPDEIRDRWLEATLE